MPSATLTNKGVATRLKVLQQARQMLIEKGYGKLVMREVAGSCGMKLGNLQYYFPSCDDLVKAVIEAEVQKDLQAISCVTQRHKDPKKKIKRIVGELMTRWRSDSAIVFSTLYILVLHDETYRTYYNNTYKSYYRLLEDTLEEACPGLSTLEYAQRSRLLFALIDGAPYQTHLPNKADFLSRIEDQAYKIATGA